MLLVGGISLLVGSGLHVVDDAQLDRELLIATMELALVLVAFTTGWRHRLIYGHHARMVPLGLLLGVWGAGEALARGLFGGALLVYGYLFVSELTAGEALSLGLLDQTVSRTFNVIRLVVQLIIAGYPRE